MENALVDVAERALIEPRYLSVLDALKPIGAGKPGRLTLPELFSAWNAGAMDALIRKLDSPPVGEACAAFLETQQDYQVHNGIRMLLELLPAEATELSYLLEARNITRLCTAAERQGLKRNYVRRSLYNSISKLLQFHYGRNERGRVFADVRFPKAKDGRDVVLNQPEIRQLLEACREVANPAYPHSAELMPIVFLAVATGADRAPILRLMAKDVEVLQDMDGETYGILKIRDSKTDARPRSVEITEETIEVLAPFLEGKSPSQNVFTITRNQLVAWWRKARRAAGLQHVRFKDLRHTFGTHADKAGLSLSGIKDAMGHERPATTMRYTMDQSKLRRSDAQRIMKQLGLARPEKLKSVQAG